MAIPTPDNYPGVPGTILYAGIAPPSGDLRLITPMEVVSTSGSLQSSVPVTFGHPFAIGDFNPSTESLYAKVDDVEVPVQIDEISTFDNGTARMGVVSVQLPSLSASATKGMQLFAGPKITPSVTGFSADGYDPIVTLNISGVTWTASPRAQLLSQMSSGVGRRLYGTVAQEYRVSVPFKNTSNVDHTQLRARFDIRLLSNGSIRTDMIIENGWLLTSTATFTYSTTCTNGASTLFTQASFTHRPRARWHKIFWVGAEVQTRPKHNKAYFLDSRITWNYDRTLVVSNSSLATLQSQTNASNTGPMGSCLLTVTMPDTGGRAEIAPVPTWTAMYLTSQDPRAYDSMLKNADACASAPVHYRDQASDRPVNINDYPNIAIRYGSGTPTVPATAGTTPWTVDVAHQGSYSFIPYVVTGDHWYLEQMLFWSTWNICASDPGSRGTTKNLIYSEQPRGQAWGTRSMLEMLFALPDSHYFKNYFKSAINDNAAWFNANYTNPAGGSLISPMGALISLYNSGQSPSYECDFFMYVLSWGLENGLSVYQPFFNNIARMQVDRVLESTQSAGFCTSAAPGYWMLTKDASNNWITSWSGFYSRNYGSAACVFPAPTSAPGYADLPGGYAAVLRGMLGAATNAGHPNGLSGFTRYSTWTPLLGSAYMTDPAYCVVPR